MPKRAIFLDRDGTIIVERNYLKDPDLIELEHNALAGLKRLYDTGWPLIVLSNQSGVGRGYMTPSDVEAVTERLARILESHGVKISGWYYCPHKPDDHCECRKPRAGLAKQAASEHNIDLRGSIVVGDKDTDVEVADKIGGSALLVLTGYGKTTEASKHLPSSHVGADLLDAAEKIIALIQARE